MGHPLRDILLYKPYEKNISDGTRLIEPATFDECQIMVVT